MSFPNKVWWRPVYMNPTDECGDQVDGSDPEVFRIAVPGGWLYHVSGEHTSQVVFVPLSDKEDHYI